MREVVRGDKHNLRKSANRNAQISVIHSAHCTDLCFAQSPFLFPIVFSINLIPFFRYLLSRSMHTCCFSTRLFGYVLLYLGRCAVATVAVCGFGSWSLVFDCGMPRQISPLPPTPSQTEVCSTITMGESIHEKAYIQVRPSSFSQSNALRE